MLAILLYLSGMRLPKNVTAFKDRHGRTRYRFRKTGLPSVSIPAEPGTEQFTQVLRLARKGEADLAAVKKITRRRKPPAKVPEGELVYFVAAGSRIKIGWTAKLRERLYSLRTSSAHHVRLLATAPGDRSLEREYHELFAAHRVRREWFKRVPEIEVEIANLANGGSPVLANHEKGVQ